MCKVSGNDWSKGCGDCWVKGLVNPVNGLIIDDGEYFLLSLCMFDLFVVKDEVKNGLLN